MYRLVQNSEKPISFDSYVHQAKVKKQKTKNKQPPPQNN